MWSSKSMNRFRISPQVCKSNSRLIKRRIASHVMATVTGTLVLVALMYWLDKSLPLYVRKLYKVNYFIEAFEYAKNVLLLRQIMLSFYSFTYWKYLNCHHSRLPIVVICHLKVSENWPKVLPSRWVGNRFVNYSKI